MEAGEEDALGRPNVACPTDTPGEEDISCITALTGGDRDNRGHSESTDGQVNEGAEVSVVLTTTQAAQLLGVDIRTVRRYISDGLRDARGATIKLIAHQARAKNGLEWQIHQADLDLFRAARDGQDGNIEPMTSYLQHDSHAHQELATAAMQLVAGELERRGLELEKQRGDLERLATEKGQLQGREAALEHENEWLRRRVQILEAQIAEQPQRGLFARFRQKRAPGDGHASAEE